MKCILTTAVALAVSTSLIAGSAQATQPSVRQACMADFEKICAGTPLTRGAVQRCIKGKEDVVTVGCKTSMDFAAKTREARKAARAASKLH